MLWIVLFVAILLGGGLTIYRLFFWRSGSPDLHPLDNGDDSFAQFDLLDELRHSLFQDASTPPATTVLHQYLSFVGSHAVEQGWVKWDVPATCTQGRKLYITAHLTRDLVSYIHEDMARDKDASTQVLDLRTHIALVLESARPGVLRIGPIETIGDRSWRWSMTPRRAGRQRVRLIIGCTIEWYARFLQETYVTEQVIGVQASWAGKFKALLRR